MKSKLRATRTSSRMLLKHLECFSAHHAHSKHLTSSSKQETLSSQAPNMLCPCLLLLTPNKRFKHSSQLMQCKLVVHVTRARHPVNCKGTHKEVKNFHTYERRIKTCGCGVVAILKSASGDFTARTISKRCSKIPRLGCCASLLPPSHTWLWGMWQPISAAGKEKPPWPLAAH